MSQKHILIQQNTKKAPKGKRGGHKREGKKLWDATFHTMPQAMTSHHLNTIIHDMNNSLMVIGLTANRLETLIEQTAHMSQNAMVPACDLMHHHHTLVRNITHIRDMLCELSESTAHQPAHHERLEACDAMALKQFFASQKAEWALILLPETKIHIRLVPFQGVVMVNDAHLARLFQNLVRNACEAYQLSDCPKEAPYLQLTIQADKSLVRFSLADNGPGVDDAQARHIFTPFKTSKKKGRLPNGLGLSSARALAMKMGGDLYLDTSYKAGACFVLTLPKSCAIT